MKADALYQKACTKCGVAKTFEHFAGAKNGRYGLRGSCRSCDNIRRKQHYHSAHEQKLAKRREYESRPDVADRKRVIRSDPAVRAKEREAQIRYKSRPDIAQQLEAYRLKRQAIPEVRARIVLNAALSRASKRSIPFSLNYEWVLSRVIAGRCEVTGLPFDFGRSSTRRNPFLPSIDQIDAGKGYTESNCRLVLVAINLALCDWGLDQFLLIARHALQTSGFTVLEPFSKAA